MAHCTGCSGTCCTGLGNDPCTCDETRTSHDGWVPEEPMAVAEAIVKGTDSEGHYAVKLRVDHDDGEGAHDEFSLGSCGCTDYHMADCPLVTG